MAEAGTTLHEHLARKGRAVHRAPVNEYQKFINVSVFVRGGVRQDAVLQAQQTWRGLTSIERQEQLKLMTERAINKLDRERAGEISSFFAGGRSLPKHSTAQAMTGEEDKPPLCFYK